MLKRFVASLLFLALATLAAIAQSPAPQFDVQPTSGPVAGGTEVRVVDVRGTAFQPDVSYSLFFGSTVVPATRISITTLVARTPAHLPATVPVSVLEGGRTTSTGVSFTFEGSPEGVFERVLLPVYTESTAGAFGADFRTDFHARLVHGEVADIYGLSPDCEVLCSEGPDAPYRLTPDAPDLDQARVRPDGTPGQFVFVPSDQADRLSMNLRTYDTSRAEENFGTEIPLVRSREFVDGAGSIALLGIPTDARFRNTLRIYGAGPFGCLLLVSVSGDGMNPALQLVLELTPSVTLTHPAYVEFSNFPVGVGTVRVTVMPFSVTSVPPPPIWAFVSVTNNQTQHITVISPNPNRGRR